MTFPRYLSWGQRRLSWSCLSPCPSSCSWPWPAPSAGWSARSAADSSSCWPCCPSSPPAPPARWWRCCCCWRWCCTLLGGCHCPPGKVSPWTWHCHGLCCERTSTWSHLTLSHLKSSRLPLARGQALTRSEVTRQQETKHPGRLGWDSSNTVQASRFSLTLMF